jgi:hypothetical protein
MTRYKEILVILVFMVFAATGSAQVSMTGIGLSGSPIVRDTVVVDGDTVHVIATFTTFAGWNVTHAALATDSLDQVHVHFFADTLAQDTVLLESRSVGIIPNSFTIDTINTPHRVQFRLHLNNVINPRFKALQLEMALLADNGFGNFVLSPMYTSHIRIVHSTALENPVDGQHATYLMFRDVRTHPITFVAPDDGTVFNRTLGITYNQSEEALAGTLKLIISNPEEELRTLYLRNRQAGSRKSLNLNALSLFDFVLVDSMTGANSLTDRLAYQLVLTYQDINRNAAASDTLYRLTADFITRPISIVSPLSGSTLGRNFRITYDQNEDASPRTLVLSIQSETEGTRLLYLHDTRGGSGKTLNLNATSMVDSVQVDSMFGTATLTNGARYRFMLTYQDIYLNPAARDTVDSLTLDMATQRPTLYEPHMGSSSSDSTIRFLYYLPERADTVWITFTMDTMSADTDEMSPHIFALVPDFNGPGIVNFDLDGRNIGTNNPLILQSNRAPEDSLVARCVYSVTLTYRDEVHNAPASVTNANYVWPRDNVTITPQLITPRENARFSSALRVEFTLPETPLPGTVRLQASADTNDLGSPHFIYFSVRTSGTSGLVLDATNLRYSAGVDSVTGRSHDVEVNNRFVHGLRYILTLSYRDSLGNPTASGPFVHATFDNQTAPPAINYIQNGSTLPRSDFEIDYNQPEPALPGSLQLILLQTGGPDIDLGSPHILYLSNEAAGNHKGFSLQPASLGASGPMDSLAGGQFLVPRSYYRMTLQYRDTLGNAYGTANIDSLFYPSGASVYIRGTELGSGFVMPGDTASQLFRVALRTDGGESALRGLRFHSQGTADVHDVVGRGIRLWMSVDSILSPDNDHIVNHLNNWSGADMSFDSFAVALGINELNFFVTCDFASTANASHKLSVYLTNSDDVDCGGDPLQADAWPIGNPDRPLNVELTSFATAQDTAIGALRVLWTVGSEFNNAGFRLARLADGDSIFEHIASYASDPGLVGQGTSPEARSYQYTDHGLTPGKQYSYKLSAVSFGFDILDFDTLAKGIPRIPPTNFVLADAYPNPFNQQVNISYFVPYTARVELTIYNVLGREVRQLVKAIQPAAEFKAQWDGLDNTGVPVPSGLYFYRLTGGGRFDQTKKLLLVR